MKTLAILALLMSSGLAHAGALPIDGAYGTEMGCAALANRDAAGDPESIVYVTRTEAAGMEYGCQVGEVTKVGDGYRAKLSCDGEGDHFSTDATLVTVAKDKVVWSVDGAPYVLTRCD